MNRTGRVILALVAGMLGLCLCLVAAGYITLRATGRVLGQALEGDPVAVAEAGSRIAEYDVPAGFDEGYSADLAGFSLVGYTGADERSHIYLFQAPADVIMAPADIELQFRTNVQQHAGPWLMEVERCTCEIRGQQTTLVVSEGATHDDERYRTASALFDGKGGQALVNISMPSATWDQEMVDAFLASLR